MKPFKFLIMILVFMIVIDASGGTRVTETPKENNGMELAVFDAESITFDIPYVAAEANRAGVLVLYDRPYVMYDYHNKKAWRMVKVTRAHKWRHLYKHDKQNGQL